MTSPVHSMTGFASGTFSWGEAAHKIEIKTLNHRFLDLKLRVPRDFAALEPGIKALVESRLGRGSVDLWIERMAGPAGRAEIAFSLQEGVAERAYERLCLLRERLGIERPVELSDLLRVPEVMAKGPGEERSTEQMKALGTAVQSALEGVLGNLRRMRAEEGERLRKVLQEDARELGAAHERLHLQRNALRERAREKVKRRIEQCFEGYPSAEERVRALLETRISQEVALVLEKLDVEEELNRFRGHVEAIGELLARGGSVGKKLDFLLQELNREINTLGNKAQDLEISREVIDMKMRVEQMREQSLNLE